MSENTQGCLILALYPIFGALFLGALLSNTIWSGVVVAAAVGLWWLDRRRRRRLRGTSADGLPIDPNQSG
jgi:hypothetical protein